jgi:hypothetical protein
MGREKFLQKFYRIRWLFSFRKPRFIECEFVDILIEEKPLFLIVWKLDGGYKICLKGTGIKLREKSGAKIIMLGNMPGSIRLTAHSFWRSTTVIISLKYIKLDDKSAAALLRELQNPTSLEVKNLVPYLSCMVPHIRLLKLQTNAPRIRYYHKFHILSQQFTFK